MPDWDKTWWVKPELHEPKPTPVTMTEDDIAEQIRVAFETAAYARKNSPDEFDAVFAELRSISEWQLERKSA
jgi:hypothetical protein